MECFGIGMKWEDFGGASW